MRRQEYKSITESNEKTDGLSTKQLKILADEIFACAIRDYFTLFKPTKRDNIATLKQLALKFLTMDEMESPFVTFIGFTSNLMYRTVYLFRSWAKQKETQDSFAAFQNYIAKCEGEKNGAKINFNIKKQWN